MENKNVGWLIIGIGAIMAIIVLIFNFTLKNLLGKTCNHGASCSMYNSITVQTGLSMGLVTLIFIIGITIMFSKPREKIIIKKVKQKKIKKKIETKGLDLKEKKAVKILQEEGAMFQADLKEKLEVGKVKMTRILDKLEAKQIIERKRRGMNNLVVLKD